MGKGYIATLAANCGREAKTEIMLQEPSPQTWSARMPAYCYTVLCPVQGLRRYQENFSEKKGSEYL